MRAPCLFALVVVALGTSCETQPSANVPAPVTAPTLSDLAPTCEGEVVDCAEYADETIIFDDEAAEGIISVEVNESGRMRLAVEDTARWMERLQPGTPMVRQRQNRTPFLRRVIEAREVDGVIEVETERARLKDAFRRGRFRKSVRVSTIDADPNTQPLKVGCDVDFEIGGGAAHAGLEGCTLDLDVDVVVTGSWGFSHGDFGEVVVEGAVIAGTDIYFELDGSVAFGAERSLNKKVVALLAYPGLLDLVVETRAGYNVGLDGTALATTGFDYEATLRAGAGYLIGDGLYGVWEPESTFTRRPFALDASVSIAGEVYVKPTFAIAAFSSLDASVGIKVYGEAQISADATVKEEIAGGPISVDADLCYDIAVGVEPVIEAEASVLGIVSLASVSLSPPPHFHRSLLNECVEVNFGADTVCTADATCQIDADCAPSDACHVARCTADCRCAERPLKDCCLSDDECSGIGVRAEGVCVGNRCAQKLAIGACSEDDDCDDGKVDTVDTCGLNGARPSCIHTANVNDPSPLGVHACLNAAGCDDENDATIDSCVLAQCEHTPVPPCGGSCDDGKAGTLDSCIDNRCTHVVIPQGTAGVLPLQR